MNKKLFISLVFICALIYPTKVNALSSSDYSSRHNCSSFELARAESNGTATKIGCYNTYSEAKNAMNSNSNSNLFIFDERSTTKIVDAKYALVDLTVNSLTNFYESSSLNTRIYMSINTSSTYGGVDAAFIETNSSNFAAKVKIANFTGWIDKSSYEIVPIAWVKSKSSYTVSSNSIRHNYVEKIQETYSGSKGSTIGPKPSQISTGTYYSYDGHYFYTSLTKMLDDYKANNYNNSVNSNNPYYNYYMYLSNHTKSTYSSVNIDEYVRNNLNYKQGIFGDTAYNGASRLYGQGNFFYNSQQIYGINALLSFSLSRNETGNGRSSLAINKNNGFGLNAVDTNPTQAANWYPTFSSSIFGYASKWNSYGYSYATDWRYFGPAFGDKFIGMNVKYATDAYWSEKMASNYYNFDNSKGLNDYNYYQLGVVNSPTNAYLNPSNSSKFIYVYPEAEDQLVIVGESGNWYKVVSDINIDANGNAIGSKTDYTKPYNWNTSFVYVEKSKVKLINTGKNGYISPNSVTEFKDSKYTYDLYIEDNTLKPKVAVTTKETNYYYDSALTSIKSQKVLKDKLVMVYSAAYDNTGKVVSYLITSNYKYDQKEWVSSDSIRFVTSDYGLVSVKVEGHYSWVNSSPHDVKETVIGGQYSYSYVPLIETVKSDGILWYKVPVNLEGTDNSVGYIIKEASDANVTLLTSYATNNNPIINAKDKTFIQGKDYDLKENVTAVDSEDGDITSKIVINSNVDINKAGTYKVTYSVTDKDNATTTKEITVIVKEDKIPEIKADNKKITVNKEFNVLKDISAIDSEDGDITSKIVIDKNTVNNKKIGNYEVVYKVKDSYGHEVTKKITVEVVKDQNPIIEALDRQINLNSNFDPLENVTVNDAEDGNITKNIKIIENTVDITKPGTYNITYQIEDSYKNVVTKQVKITVIEIELQEKEATFYFDYLKKKDGILELKGYQTINGVKALKTSNINYRIIFENTDTNEQIIKPVTRIMDSKEMSRPVFSIDGLDYTYSWFKYKFNLNELKSGNYRMYIECYNDLYYSKTVVSNKLYKEQATSYSDGKYAVIQNNYNDRLGSVEIKVRDELLAKKESSYIYNQFDTYRTFEFNNDSTLHLKGLSYSYGADLGKNINVERKIIFENKETYKTYKYNLGSITNGLYKAVLPEDDNLDKTRAWYDNNIDISNIPKGEYVIYITTTSNITDISEFSEKLNRNLDVEKIINGKNYKFIVNIKKGSRIELIVS